MLGPVEFNIRTLEHNQRVDDVNKYGWLRPESSYDGRKITLGAVLRAVGAKFAPGMPELEDSSLRIGLDTSAFGTGAQRVA
jgi:hypothetical protein